MKKYVLILVSISLLLILSACSSSKTGSKQSDDALEAFIKIVKSDPSKKGFHAPLKHWGFKLDDDKFEWTKDTSANKIDFAMVMSAKPFLDAGLDPKKLNDSNYVFKPKGIESGMKTPDLLIHPFNLNDKKQTAQGSKDSFRRLLKEDINLVKYHKGMKHYRLLLNDGFEVQWTEKLGLTNADMVFIIEANPLIDAGLDTSKLDGTGWIFKKAEKDEMGNHPNRLVKIYDLKKSSN
ncbi:MAG: hypothetical protein K0R71_760 [Bacillales bacterium]|nr:hypothetical protein [Bacillales bacterium]